jgi:drug/metabolite transporter (DMT)-like permease
VLALGLVYGSWGTTYLAIREGVQTLPPALFGGTRVALAGLLLLTAVGLRGGPVRLPRRETLWAWLVGGLMFVGGNGLVTFAEKTVPSGVAAVIVATTPLWMALLETAWPRGERLRPRGWLGLFVGLAGVAILWSDQLLRPAAAFGGEGPFLVLGSAGCWALGAFLHRHGPARGPHLTTAAYQMLLGGASLSLLGLLLGEAGELSGDRFTPGAVFAFFYLLVVGSLVGFTAFTWLLGHTSAALSGTYAYVNPVVALLAGWLVAKEQLSVAVVVGMAVILGGVALVRLGSFRRAAASVPRLPAGERGRGEGAPADARGAAAEGHGVDNGLGRCYLQNQAPPSA